MWKDVVGYEGFYQVSDEGEVMSLVRLLPSAIARGDRRHKNMIKPCAANHGGRLRVVLCAGGNPKIFQVHRLVLEAFQGACPEGMEARHLDGDHLNNRNTNLVWGTREENRDDARRHGSQAQGERMPQSKLTEADVRAIRSSAENQPVLAEKYGVSQVSISNILRRKTWKHVE